MKRYLLTIFVAIGICSVAGCMSSGDVDAAIKVAADLNLDNAKIATQDKSAVHDVVMGKLEASFERQLGATKGGDEAVKLLVAYRSKKAELSVAKAADMEQYAKMLDNASLIVALIDKRIALRARWEALLGLVPAVAHIKALAEVEARQFMQGINKGTTP